MFFTKINENKKNEDVFLQKLNYSNIFNLIKNSKTELEIDNYFDVIKNQNVSKKKINNSINSNSCVNDFDCVSSGFIDVTEKNNSHSIFQSFENFTLEKAKKLYNNTNEIDTKEKIYLILNIDINGYFTFNFTPDKSYVTMNFDNKNIKIFILHVKNYKYGFDISFKHKLKKYKIIELGKIQFKTNNISDLLSLCKKICSN